MKNKPTSPLVSCDVSECKSAWIIVIYIRDGNTVKHSVKLCSTHFKEFRAGKSPTLRG